MPWVGEATPESVQKSTTKRQDHTDDEAEINERSAMNQKFECIEKHLYRRQYQTAGGNWSTLYYVIFTDWKKKRRTFPVGSDLKTAREELRVYQARNIRKEDFDVKIESEPPERLTIAKY